jgi:hypothetical protein
MESQRYLALATLAVIIGLIAATAPKILFSEPTHVKTMSPSDGTYNNEACTDEGYTRVMGEEPQRNLDTLTIILTIPLILSVVVYLGTRRISWG